MQTATEKLSLMLQPAIEALELELWGIEYLAKGRSALLRVYIDNENENQTPSSPIPNS